MLLKNSLLHCFKEESSVGILLLVAVAMAMIMANSPYSELYNHLTELRVTVSIDIFVIDKSLLHWINDRLNLNNRLGILIGSFISGLGGYYLLKYQLRERPSNSPKPKQSPKAQ